MLNKIFLFCALSLCVYAQSEENKIQHEESIACNYNEKDEIIHLEESGLDHIHEEFVTSDKIKCLNLQGNKITKIEKNALNGLPNLQFINLTGNKLNCTTIFDGNKYENIKTLILDKALKDEKLCKNITCEKELSLTTKLSNLKNLYLRGNNLTSLFIESWMDQVPNLTHLYLSYNQLTTVDFMSDVSCTLTHLYIDHNQIDLFINTTMENLIELVMDHNRIYTLCGADDQCAGGILKNANKLEKLSLSNVQLSYIYPTTMNDLVKLLELDLSHNQIQVLDDIFNNTIHLKVLKLHNNQLIAVPNVCSLINLEILTLNDNEIPYIDHQQFACKMSSLKQLWLNNNQIMFISSEAFVSMTKLEILDLSGNQLKSLSTNWISQENNLQRLNLNNNLFTHTSSMRLDNVAKLQVLNISGNPLKNITVKSFKYLPENTTVDVMQGHRCY